MIQIHSGKTSQPRDFVARSVAARPHALKLALLTCMNLWEVNLVDEMHFVKVVCSKEDQIFWEEEAEKQIFLKVIRRFEHSFWGDKCVSMLFSKCFGQTFTIFLKFREMSKYLINLGEWIWNWMALSSGIVAL